MRNFEEIWSKVNEQKEEFSELFSKKRKSVFEDIEFQLNLKKEAFGDLFSKQKKVIHLQMNNQ